MSDPGDRLSKKKSPLSGTLVSFTLFVNLGVIALLFRQTPFVNTFLAFLTAIAGVLFVLVLIVTYIKGRKKPVRVRVNEVNLFLHYLRTTRKYILVSIVGMVLAVLILSQAFLVPQLYEERVVNAYFGNIEYVETFSVQNYADIGFPEDGKSNLLNLTNMMQSLDLLYSATVNGLKGTELPVVFGFDDVGIYGNLNQTKLLEQIGSNDIRFFSASIYPLTPRNQDFLNRSYGGNLHFTNESVVSVIPSSVDQTYLRADTIPLLKFTEFGEEELELNVTDHLSESSSKVLAARFYYSELVLFVSVELFNTYVAWMEAAYFGSTAIRVYSETPPPDNIRDQLESFRGIENTLNKELSKQLGGEFYIYSPYLEVLEEVVSILEGVRISVLFLVSPIIGLGLYLMYFSSTLVERRRKTLLTIMKIRGTNEAELKLLFLTEIVVGSVIATAVGMVLSIPWASLSLDLREMFWRGQGQLRLLSIGSL